MFERDILEELFAKTIKDKIAYETIDKILDELLLPEIAKHVYDNPRVHSTQTPLDAKK